jgi:hypothetical protein
VNSQGKMLGACHDSKHFYIRFLMKIELPSS